MGKFSMYYIFKVSLNKNFKKKQTSFVSEAEARRDKI